MGGYIIRRLLSLIPVLVVVSVVVFSIIHITPGDPATIILGEGATPEQIKELNQKLGLNQPIYIQYFIWTLGLLGGDLGTSYFLGKPVIEAFLENLGPTVSLAILAQVIGVTLALIFGIIAARNKGKFKDEAIMGLSLFGISIPGFLLGSFLIIIFSVQFKLLPASGYQPLSEGVWEHFKYLILPAITLGTIQAALITRMTRSSLIETLSENFIKTAKAKGLNEKTIMLKHTLRVAFLPILTVIGESFGGLVTGAAVTEALFNIPGLGQLIVTAINRRDYAIIQGSILLITVIYVCINLFVDLLYAVIDPRIRNSYRS